MSNATARGRRRFSLYDESTFSGHLLKAVGRTYAIGGCSLLPGVTAIRSDVVRRGLFAEFASKNLFKSVKYHPYRNCGNLFSIYEMLKKARCIGALDVTEMDERAQKREFESMMQRCLDYFALFDFDDASIASSKLRAPAVNGDGGGDCGDLLGKSRDRPVAGGDHATVAIKDDESVEQKPRSQQPLFDKRYVTRRSSESNFVSSSSSTKAVRSGLFRGTEISTELKTTCTPGSVKSLRVRFENLSKSNESIDSLGHAVATTAPVSHHNKPSPIKKISTTPPKKEKATPTPYYSSNDGGVTSSAGPTDRRVRWVSRSRRNSCSVYELLRKARCIAALDVLRMDEPTQQHEYESMMQRCLDYFALFDFDDAAISSRSSRVATRSHGGGGDCGGGGQDEAEEEEALVEHDHVTRTNKAVESREKIHSYQQPQPDKRYTKRRSSESNLSSVVRSSISTGADISTELQTTCTPGKVKSLRERFENLSKSNQSLDSSSLAAAVSPNRTPIKKASTPIKQQPATPPPPPPLFPMT